VLSRFLVAHLSEPEVRPIRTTVVGRCRCSLSPVLEKLGASMPNATRKSFANAGHLPHVTDVPEYVETLVRFFVDVSQT
jgi:hypothetical protein